MAKPTAEQREKQRETALQPARFALEYVEDYRGAAAAIRVGVAKSQIHILAGLTKLRQAACDPRLLGLPREFSHDDSGKLATLRELVNEVESGGHKVLVFSQFVTNRRTTIILT